MIEYPKKRDWKKGVPQIGVFLRTEDGGMITMVNDRASPAEKAFVCALLRGLKDLPRELIVGVEKANADRIAAYDAEVAQKRTKR